MQLIVRKLNMSYVKIPIKNYFIIPPIKLMLFKVVIFL